ncbi:MAG: hypothetical protein R2873_17140 [Caldilineaceae bacterium]
MRQMFSRGWIWIILLIVFFFGYRILFNSTNSTDDMVGLNQVAEWVAAQAM